MTLNRAKRATASILAIGAVLTGISLLSAGTANADTYIYPTEHSCNDARNDLAVSSAAGHDSTFEYLVIDTCSAQYGRWQFHTQWIQR